MKIKTDYYSFYNGKCSWCNKDLDKIEDPSDHVREHEKHDEDILWEELEGYVI